MKTKIQFQGRKEEQSCHAAFATVFVNDLGVTQMPQATLSNKYFSVQRVF